MIVGLRLPGVITIACDKFWGGGKRKKLGGGKRKKIGLRLPGVITSACCKFYTLTLRQRDRDREERGREMRESGGGEKAAREMKC